MLMRWIVLTGLCAVVLGQVRPTNSIPRLVKKLEYGDYGSKYHRFGDLDGDGLSDVLLVQATAPGGEHKAILTCLTALNLEGKILWQVGTPDPKNISSGAIFRCRSSTSTAMAGTR